MKLCALVPSWQKELTKDLVLATKTQRKLKEIKVKEYISINKIVKLENETLCLSAFVAKRINQRFSSCHKDSMTPRKLKEIKVKEIKNKKKYEKFCTYRSSRLYCSKTS